MAEELDSFSQALYDEVMGEMAGTFFGTRTRLEELTHVLLSMVDKLRPMADAVILRGKILHWLLPDVDPMYDLLGLDSGPLSVLFRPDPAMRPVLSGSAPFAFTEAGRFARAVVRAYAEVHTAADEYMHGAYSVHPSQPGRKVVSLHFLQVREFCVNLNARIQSINLYQSPSGALQSMRNMHPEELDLQRVTGATIPGMRKVLIGRWRWRRWIFPA